MKVIKNGVLKPLYHTKEQYIGKESLFPQIYFWKHGIFVC